MSCGEVFCYDVWWGCFVVGYVVVRCFCCELW